MTLIEWREEYATGISGVDYEHEELIALINSVYEMLEDKQDKLTIISCLGEIYGRISSHFALEERWMEQHNYDDYETHKNDHERLLNDIGSITDEFETTAELNTEQLQKKLNDWFLCHFKTHDARLHLTNTSNTQNSSRTTSVASDTSNKPVAIWLLVCCATVFAMVVLGGVTRLTGSGLSMVQWEPIMGALPPLSQASWEETFQLYQQFPEFKLKNFSMTLQEFKSIFWFEYAHRVLGRTIGIVFFLPFVFFLVTKKIKKSLTPKLITMFVLGGLQGLMGWYMVKSGLVNDPHVSQYRLTAHLCLAVIIYAYMLWVALDLLLPRNCSAEDSANTTQKTKLAQIAAIITSIIFVTIISGGFVAGTHAGFAFNTFPLMNGQLIPDGLFTMTPVWHNFFENIITVQFDHRVLATTLFFIIPAFWLKTRKLDLEPMSYISINLLLAALILQIVLGISTLLLVVPVPLAAAHQAGAIILLTASLFVSHQFRR